MKLILRLFVVSAAGLLILVGCQKKEEKVNEETQVEALVGELGEDEIEGKVISARNISDYAYVELDTGKEKIWIASSRSDVKAGDIIRVTPSQVMKDFESKALDRTFESIIFVATIKVVKRAKAASDDGSGSSTVDETLISDSPAKGSIDKAEGGYTIAEIFDKMDSLDGAEVTVRGKVVRINRNIMGKHWLHLQDGTGEEGSNDIVLTTVQNVNSGDIILAKATVELKKKFSEKYKFDILLEDAQITLE